MKLQKSLIILLAAAAMLLGGIREASAQAPAASPAPHSATETTVYLKHEYTKALETDKLFDSDKFVARLVTSDNNFVVFQQKGSTELIYIPTSDILYMRGPLDTLDNGPH